MDTLIHAFDCECQTCCANDAGALGMARFRKPVQVPVTQPATVKAAGEPVRRLPAGQKVGNGRVRQISDRQEWFILKLIGERDTTALKLVTGQTVDPEEIKYMGVKGASALIEKLLGCPFKNTNSPVASKFTIPGSEKQVAWIKSMATERNLSESDLKLIMKVNPTARMLIDALKAMPKPNLKVTLEAEITKASENEEYIPTTIIPGFYRDANAQVWKVQMRQDGNGMYALRRINIKKYEYCAGAIRNLAADMFVSLNPLDITLEEAKAYGRKTGSCYMCGRTLTNEESIKTGIGPICAEKF